MANRIPWDNYEIALLFDCYLKMQAEGLHINDAAEMLSKQLRGKAIRQGHQVDDKFRNKNGMVFFLLETEYIFTEGKRGKPGASRSVLRMYETYRKKPNEFQRILHAAQSTVNGLSENEVLDQSSCSDGSFLLKVDEQKSAFDKWKEILEKDFSDGYILNDFLCQFQAAAIWQERFGDTCPAEGDSIDQAISACGTVKDSRVFPVVEEEEKLLIEIADLIANTLMVYSNVYTIQVYQRYREALVSLSIFTEKVMIQQVMRYAANRFVYMYSYLFVKPGDSTVVAIDCERALRNRGGMMTTTDVVNELWFIPEDKVAHYLTVNNEILSLGGGQWMLAEHFPFTKENADQVAKLLEECFLSNHSHLNFCTYEFGDFWSCFASDPSNP